MRSTCISSPRESEQLIIPTEVVITMNFFQTLSEAVVEQSMAKKTRDCYYHHAKQFHQFIGKPAGQWEGLDVRRWLLEMERRSYSPVTRKQALCALKFVFDHLLKRDLGQLDLPPMPKVLPFVMERRIT